MKLDGILTISERARSFTQQFPSCRIEHSRKDGYTEVRLYREFGDALPAATARVFASGDAANDFRLAVARAMAFAGGKVGRTPATVEEVMRALHLNPPRAVNVKSEAWEQSQRRYYIGRPGHGYDDEGHGFGNPFKVGPDGGRATCLAKFENYVWKNIARFRPAILDLTDRELGCFCKPDSCHGDVLVKIYLELTDAKRR